MLQLYISVLSGLRVIENISFSQSISGKIETLRICYNSRGRTQWLRSGQPSPPSIFSFHSFSRRAPGERAMKGAL